MRGTIAAAGAFAAAMLYPCIRAGAQEGRQIGKMKQRGEWDAGRKGGQPEPGAG